MVDGALPPDLAAVVAARVDRGGLDLRGYLHGPVAHGVTTRMAATLAGSAAEYVRCLIYRKERPL